MHISSVQMEAIDVIYTNGQVEELGVLGSIKERVTLQPDHSIRINLNPSAYGFDEEPRVLYLKLQISTEEIGEFEALLRIT